MKQLLLFLTLFGPWISFAAPREEVVIFFGHSNCREGLVANPTPLSNVREIQLTTGLPIPMASMGGIDVPLAKYLHKLNPNTNYYFLLSCVPATTFTTGLPPAPTWGHPDFGPSSLRPYLLNLTLAPFLAAHPGVARVTAFYFDATADLVAATQNLTNLNHLADAYADLAKETQTKVPATIPLQHVVILLDGTYPPGSPFAPWLAIARDQQKDFSKKLEAKIVSASGVTLLADGTHYDLTPGNLETLAWRMFRTML